MALAFVYQFTSKTHDIESQWNGGSITVTAADGITLVATPIEEDSDNIRFRIGDAVIDRPLNEGFQVSCFWSELVECSNI